MHGCCCCWLSCVVLHSLRNYYPPHSDPIGNFQNSTIRGANYFIISIRARCIRPTDYSLWLHCICITSHHLCALWKFQWKYTHCMIIKHRIVSPTVPTVYEINWFQFNQTLYYVQYICFLMFIHVVIVFVIKQWLNLIFLEINRFFVSKLMSIYIGLCVCLRNVTYQFSLRENVWS